MDVDVGTSNFVTSEAKKQFLELLQRFSNENDSKEFLKWIHNTWPQDFSRAQEEFKLKKANAETILKDIANNLRKKLPQESILPSEKLFVPINGENKDCMPECTVHVDGFLYDDESVDELVENGLLSRTYCRDCGSRNTEPLVFISHSASQERLAYIFTALLPPLDGLTIMDIGSRLGPALYAAHLYTNASSIIGIEMNKDLCKIQEEIVEKYEFKDRVKVVADDVTNLPDLVHSADVVLLHNVFEFFLPEADQEKAWRFLHQSVKPGTILVTTPPLSTSLRHLKLQTGIDLNTWVTELPPNNPVRASSAHWQDEAMEVTMYRVL